MATAIILINSSTPPALSLNLGDAVTLTNSDDTGVTTWLWEFVDKPAGSLASLTTPTSASSTFTVDTEGTYLIKLTVNGSITNTAVGAAKTLLTGIRYPAAFEQTEADATRGWAADLNAAIRLLEVGVRTGGTIVAVVSHPLTYGAGTPVKITGPETILSDGTIIPSVGPADSSAVSNLPAIGIALSNASVGSRVVVRTHGYCDAVSINSPAPNTPVYVDDLGALSTTPGTNSYIIGYTTATSAISRMFVAPAVAIQSGGTGSSFWTDNGTEIYNTNSGNVGIGTSTPVDKLEVDGNMTINSVFARPGMGATFAVGFRPEVASDPSDITVYGEDGDVNVAGGSVSISAGNSGTGTAANAPAGGALNLIGSSGGNGSGAYSPGAGGDVVIEGGQSGIGGTGTPRAGDIVFRPVDSASGGARSLVRIDAKDYYNDGLWIKTQNPADDNYDVGYLRDSTGFLVRVGFDAGGGYEYYNLMASYSRKIIMPPYGETGTVENTLCVNTAAGYVGIGCDPYLGLDIAGNIRLRSTGVMYFGGTGISDYDTNLYRSAANRLKTDDEFVAMGIVGIGCDPYVFTGHKLHINMDAASSSVTNSTFSDTASDTPRFNLRRGRGTYAAPTSVLTSDTLGEIRYQGQTNSGISWYTNGATIRGVAAQDWSVGNAGTALDFLTCTNSAAGNPTFKMRLSNDGRLGVGIDTPYARIDAKDAITTTYSTSGLNVPSLRGYNVHSAGVNGSYASLVLQTSSNDGTDSSIAQIACVQDRAGSNSTGSALSVVLRRDNNVGYFEPLRISAAGKFTFTTPAVDSANESILKVVVTGSGNDAMYWTNGTSLDGTYLPQFSGICDTVNNRYSLGFIGFTSSANDASDSSEFGLIDFNALRTSVPSDPITGSLTSPVNRKLYTWRNAAAGGDAAIKMVMYADGSLEVDKQHHTLYVDATDNRVGIGTNSPSYPLHVMSSNTSGMVYVQNTNTSGYSTCTVLDSGGFSKMSFGYGNAAIPSFWGGKSYIAITANFAIGRNTDYAIHMYLDNTNMRAGFGGVVDPYFDIDADSDLRLRSSNKLYFGGTGSADADVNLYRSAANVLKTDDDFYANHFVATGAEWDDVTVSLASTNNSSLNQPQMMLVMDNTGTGGTTGGIWADGFINNREDSVLFPLQLPHSWKEGSSIKAHIHWTMVTATTGTVRWGIEYAWANVNGQYRKYVAPNAANARQRSGTIARLTFTTAHDMVVGQNIVVAGAGSADYNGNYVITAVSDTAGARWIEYTIASGSETSTVDAAVYVYGYTIQIASTITLSTDSQYKHIISDIGTIAGATGSGNKTVSHMLLCRLYREQLGGHIAERIPAVSVDFHILKDTIGSKNETTK